MTVEVPIAPQRSKSLVMSVVANGILAVGVVVLAAVYYQASRDIEAHKASIAALQAEVAGSKSDTAREAARVAELKADLTSARTTNESLAAASKELQSNVEETRKALMDEAQKAATAQIALEKEITRLPALPVRIEFRRSAVGRGLVAMVTNTSSLHLPVVMIMRNPTTNQAKQLSFQLAPGQRQDVGYVEGWQFASGDQMGLRSAGFEITKTLVP